MALRGRRSLSVAAAAMLLLLAACAATDVTARNPSGYVADAPARLAAADWSRAETIDLAMSEYQFSPSALHFRNGQAYRLHLVNTGTEAHDFSSDAFFQAIAVRDLATASGDVPSPLLRSVGVAPGASKDLFFVAVKPGTYPFDCNEPLHSLFGMTGRAVID